MKITVKIRVSLFLLSLLFIAARWPFKEKRGLTSSFGEWRDGRLHAGIDIPTIGIGEEIYSVSDGWVMRARTSPWGYGKGIYVRDSLGRIFVYGHLSSFHETIKRIIREEQLKKQSYEVDIWFKKKEISVKEGETIGRSGRSGCLGPHLHFEMRDQESNPIDPLIRGFSVSDTIAPFIYAIRLVPLDDTSTVCGFHLGAVIETEQDTPSVYIKGRVGLEIETYDKVNGHSGQLAPKEIELYMDGKLLRKEYYDRFSYSHVDDSRFEFDFSNRIRTGRKFRRLFTVMGNDLPFYQGRGGILTTYDRGLVTIIVRDAASNEGKTHLFVGEPNTCDFNRVRKQIDNLGRITTYTNGIFMRQSNSLHWIEAGMIGSIVKSGDSIRIWNIKKRSHSSFESPDSRCTIYPLKNSILNTTLISVKVSKEEPTKWIWEPPIPLNGRVTMEVKIPSRSPFYSIYELIESEWEYYATEFLGDKLRTTVDHLGTFAILQDTVPPVISIKKNYSKLETHLQVHVSDSLSGVDFHSIKTFIDGNPTVFRYDLEMDQLIHEYPEEIPEGMHTIRVFLRDNQGNEASREWEFEKKD